MRKFYSIGGGELKERTTLKLDSILAEEATLHAGDKRPYALFIPTASHDHMPYYNTFHKVYTGVFNLKTDVVLTCGREIDLEKIKQKFLKADLIYIGGGDTIFLRDELKRTGVLDFLIDAYQRGVVIAGLSAGAILFFEDIYTDSVKDNNEGPYALAKGLGIFKGLISPHYNQRKTDFDNIILSSSYIHALGIEDNAMVKILDGRVESSYSSLGGNAYYIDKEGNKLNKTIIEPCIEL